MLLMERFVGGVAAVVVGWFGGVSGGVAAVVVGSVVGSVVGWMNGGVTTVVVG
jgi:TctA family transporter